MIPDPTTLHAAGFFRIDRLMVPEAARAEFLERVASTNAVMREQPGFVGAWVFEQVESADSLGFTTLTAWKDESVIPQAAVAVTEHHNKIGFDRQAFMARTGIAGQSANYRCLAFTAPAFRQ